MKEAQIQTEFSKVCRIPGVFELKLARGNSLPYKAVADHQIASLLSVKQTGFFHKISDSPIFPDMKTRFNSKKPFDCFFLKGYPAYIGICFYVPRKKREVILIDIDSFVKCMVEDTRKSITRDKAESISRHIVELK